MTNAVPTPSQSYLRECFEYNKETGEIFWKARPESHFVSISACRRFNTLTALTQVAKPTQAKYATVVVSKRQYKLHRLIYKLVTGDEAEVIDHENGDRWDNRWGNLRSVTGKENNQNKAVGYHNTSGILGVRPSTYTPERWVAEIKSEGKQYRLGTFKDKFEAICRRKSAEVKYGFHVNHGRRAV